VESIGEIVVFVDAHTDPTGIMESLAYLPRSMSSN